MEPGSGSEGSSTVEPVQVTRTRTTTALLGAVLMHRVDRVLGVRTRVLGGGQAIHCGVQRGRRWRGFPVGILVSRPSTPNRRLARLQAGLDWLDPSPRASLSLSLCERVGRL